MKRLPWPTLLIISFGCSAFINLSAEELRREKYFSGELTVDKNLEEIQQVLYNYSQTCRPMPELKINPENKNRALITFQNPNFTERSVIALIDFKQVGADSTKLTTYYYHKYNHAGTEDVTWAILMPERCR